MGTWIEILNSFHNSGCFIVVPLVGTWIEIILLRKLSIWLFVVPLVGTWIEINEKLGDHIGEVVVPLVGTWIEIVLIIYLNSFHKSFPSWERGLKSYSRPVKPSRSRRSPRGNVD